MTLAHWLTLVIYLIVGFLYATLSQFGRNLKWYRVTWMTLLWPLCLLFRVDLIEWED